MVKILRTRRRDMFFIISIILLTQHFGHFTIKCEAINDPTLKAADPFIKSDDAEQLKEELREKEPLSRDNDKIMSIICRRTFDQRKQIQQYYDNTYAAGVNRRGQRIFWFTLFKDIVDESTGSLDNLYKIMFTAPEAQLALNLHEAISGKWKEEGVVEEIACCNDPQTKKIIHQVYENSYKCSVADHLKLYKKDDGPYQEVMQKYCWSDRCQEKKITAENADKEAKALQDIDAKKDKEGFKKKLKELLDKYCEPDLKLIFEKYKKDDHRICDGVDEAFEGDEKRAFNYLVRYIENTCKFYADELYHAVDGFGTDIDKINRIIVTRCERDLNCVLNEFKSRHDKTFTQRLKSDTASEPRYRKCIQYLCGKK